MSRDGVAVSVVAATIGVVPHAVSASPAHTTHSATHRRARIRSIVERKQGSVYRWRVSWVDIVIAVIVLGATQRGFVVGILRQAGSLVGFISGFVVGVLFAPVIADRFDQNPTRPLAAAVVVGLCVWRSRCWVVAWGIWRIWPCAACACAGLTVSGGRRSPRRGRCSCAGWWRVCS